MNLDTPEHIVANADYHAKLLSTISELEYVPQAHRDQAEYLKDLQTQIEAGQNKIAQLSEKKEKERKEHESLRGSVARRFAHFVVGKKEKFAQKASKEEREYVDALEREMTERDNQNMLVGMKTQGDRVLEELKQKEARYRSTQAELQALYSRVFDGPTQAFPEEDRLEYQLIASVQKHEQAQAKVNAESRVAELLAKAANAMTASHASGKQALGYSTYDLWGGGNFADMMERNALRQAQVHASQAQMLVEQARRISPFVQPLPPIQFADGSFFGDVFFDNFFTDMAFHNKIQQSISQVLMASQTVTAERDDAICRMNAAGAELMSASVILDAQRRELDGIRRATFASYVGAQHPPPAPPPDYDHEVKPPATASNPPNENKIPQTPAFPPPLNPPPPPPAGVTSMSSLPQPNFPEPQAQAQFKGSTPAMPVPGPGPQVDLVPRSWGKNNPFAYALSEETKKLSQQGALK